MRLLIVVALFACGDDDRIKKLEARVEKLEYERAHFSVVQDMHMQLVKGLVDAKVIDTIHVVSGDGDFYPSAGHWYCAGDRCLRWSCEIEGKVLGPDHDGKNGCVAHRVAWCEVGTKEPCWTSLNKCQERSGKGSHCVGVE